MRRAGVRLKPTLSTLATPDARMADAETLADTLEEARRDDLDVVVMPDFFLDHLTRFDALRDVREGLDAAAGHGNVNLHATRQMLRAGGGAANVAHALARLGIRAHLVASTSPVGRAFLRNTIGRDGVDLTLVRDDGHLAITGAIECADCSIMIYTPSPHQATAPESLSDAVWQRVARSDAVYVGDWSNPRAFDLAAEVWRVARQVGARTYTDPGMPPTEDEARADRIEVLSIPDLDVVSLNDDELRAYADAPPDEPLAEVGARLSRELGARIDLHSNALTASFERGRLAGEASRFRVAMRQATGAGDTWTAASIAGDLFGLDADERLMLANAVAAMYVASERVEPPLAEDVADFLRTGEVREDHLRHT